MSYHTEVEDVIVVTHWTLVGGKVGAMAQLEAVLALDHGGKCHPVPLCLPALQSYKDQFLLSVSALDTPRSPTRTMGQVKDGF
ncbi:hypothetical protein KIPB_009486, partial [Kipferlia bialata]|eukprot:g9486.t1